MVIHLAMSKIRLITFDATNTLFKVHSTVGDLYAKAASVHEIDADPHKVETNFRKSFHHFNTNYPNFGQTTGITSKQWWNEVIMGSFAGYRIEPMVFDELCTDLYNNFKKSMNWDVFPDVVPVLEKLNQSGVKLGVISNFDERLPMILKALDLRQFFSFIVTSRETVFCKPSLEIFNYAISLVKCRPEEATHVGDNLNLDYKAARNAGMDAFVLLRQPTDAKIEHLAENLVPKTKIMHDLQMLCTQILETK